MPLYHPDFLNHQRRENLRMGRIFPSETRSHIRKALDEGIWYYPKEKPMKHDKKKKGGKGC